MQEIKYEIQQVLTGTVGCYTDRYLIDEEKEIFLISIFGTPSRVKAVGASILVGDHVFIQPCWTTDWRQRQWVKRDKKKSFKSLNRKLCPHVAHSMIYAVDLFKPEENSEKVFFGKDMEEIHSKFFATAQQYYSTPLLPEWTDWLWQEMQPENLKAFKFDLAFKVWFTVEKLLEQRLFEDGSPIYRAAK